MNIVPLINFRVLIVFISGSICLAESCFNCGPFSPAKSLAEHKTRAFWWKNQATLVQKMWKRRRSSAMRSASLNTNMNETEVVKDISELHIPGVVNPPWDVSIPKFNCMIITRMGDIDTPICSGALISYSFVLTVGQDCVLNQGVLYSPDDLIVRFISSVSSAIDKRVQRVVLHEGCCQPENYWAHNDLVLLQLESQIYEKGIQPALITRRSALYHPSVNDLWDLSNCRVYHMALDFRDAIWFVRTRFISANTCDKLIPSKRFHKLKMTCASYYHMGSRECQTDQGSPLSYRGELIGLLVYKSFCGSPTSVGLFVNIGIHSEWIRKNVQRASNNHESV